ncbi:MAG: hypothetical protein JWM43_3555 [Acidobacteriaceae bacterium]|nr:hypothetical protein [Acidobacteriaceae bacterium]
MPRFVPIRAFAATAGLLTLCVSNFADAQGNLRPQPPSSLPVSQPPTQPPQYAPAPPPQYTPATPAAAQRAQITYAAGILTVVANNSSLNQILREISRQTGMKITGGVADDRVFGTYGPASPSKILPTLLEGTGSNMLLVQSSGDQRAAAPVELVLTPRHGGPTPPNPNAPGFSDTPDAQTDISPYRAPSGSRSAPQPDQSVPTNPGPPPSASPDSPATTQDQSPNGVKTPQQIYEQLMRLRNQTPPTPNQ